MNPTPLPARQMSPMLLTAYVLLLLIAADLLCFALHLGRMFNPDFGTEYFSLEFDRGYGEFYQYIKEFWIILLLLRLGVLKRAAGFFVWAAAYTYLLFDDAKQFHERMGSRLSQSLELPEILGMRSQDLGELLVTGGAGVVLLTLLVICYWRESAAMRRFTRQLLVLTLTIGLMGVVVDMVHSILRHVASVYDWAGFIEDGGEMLVMSLVVWYLLTVTVRDGQPLESVVRTLREALSRVVRLS